MISYNSIKIIQIGAGGTGGWLVPPLLKFLNNIRLRNIDINIEYLLIDNDTVELRNTLRQNFNEIDEGFLKVRALQRSNYWADFLKGIPERLEKPKDFKKYIDEQLLINNRSLNIVIGCVDDILTRRKIFTRLNKLKPIPTIYIDSGNELYNGQVVTCCFDLEGEYLKLRNLGRFKNPKFLKIYPKDKQENNNQNCAFFGDQSQSINMISSVMIFANIQKILIEELLPANYIQYNSSGYSNFEI